MSLSKARQLREERAALVKQAQALIPEKGAMTKEVREKFDKMMADADETKATIDRIEQAEAAEAELRGATNPGGRPPQDRIADPNDPEAEEKARKKAEEEYRKAWVAFMKHGMYPDQHGFRGISDAQRATLMKRARTVTEKEIEFRDLGTGGEGAYPGATAGFFVPVGFVNRIEEAMKWYGPMLQIAEIMETATGQPLPFPTDNDTTISGELIAEAAQVNTQDVTLSQIVFGAYKFSTKLVKVSLELLQDSAFDLETYLTRKFGIRTGRVVNTYMTTGAGTTQPNGIVTASTVGVGGSSGTAVTGDDNQNSPDPTTQIGWIDLVNLEHSVDPAYRYSAAAPSDGRARRVGAAFMFHDNTLAFIKKLKDKYGRPLWVAGVSNNEPDTINGYPYHVNNDMAQLANPSPASTRKTVLFGALDKYLIRRVKDMAVLRLVERFADFGQVAFIGFSRYDGNLLDAGTHPVRHLLNPSS